MNKYRFLACTFLTILFFVFVWAPVRAQQVFIDHSLHQIQQDYQNNIIDAEAAALLQIRHIREIQHSEENEVIKCLTPTIAFIKQYEDQFSAATLDEIQAFETSFDRREKRAQEVYISNSGKFEINYETTGTHAVPPTDANFNGVPDYVEWVGEAADDSYRIQVLEIGFRDPIPLTFRYQIYIEEMGFYGFTQTTTLGAGTEIYIENDFENFPTNTDPAGDQRGAIKATIAHEFKHAIQYAQNNWQAPSGDFAWGEMDATLMEEVVFDEVNDYYNYIKADIDSQIPGLNSIFDAPYLSVPGSYFFVSWMIYYTEVFGVDLWKQVWDQIEDDHSLPIDEAMIQVLPGARETFDEHFVRNHLWHFASGIRAPEGTYGFDEKEDYPIANTEQTFFSTPTNEVEFFGINRLAARYFEVIPQDDDEGFIEVAVNFDSTQIGLGLILYLKDGGVMEIITRGSDKGQVYVPTTVNWEDISSLGVVVANYSLNTTADNLSLEFGKNGDRIVIRDPLYAYIPEEIAVFQNYPNPFNTRTKIIFELSEPSFVSLEVFDILGRKVQTLAKGSFLFGRFERIFDASGLSSGVYLYRLQIGNKVYIKKMTLAK